MLSKIKLFITSCLLLIPCALGKLSVSDGYLSYNGQRVFLSGVNFAWKNYGNDFGIGAYNNSRSTFEGWLQQIEKAGGNAVRVWIHCDGWNTPKTDASGQASGSDVQSFITEMGEFLDTAQQHGIFIIPVLWNGATSMKDVLKKIVNDPKAEDAYLKIFLTPLVKGLANKPALAAWEIMNEPGGSVQGGQSNSNKCYDTTPLVGSGVGWTSIIPLLIYRAYFISSTCFKNLLCLIQTTKSGYNFILFKIKLALNFIN